jgi:16S rRNA G527 N7-methylase RsmG
MNLTAITNREEVIKKHFADSLSCVRIMEMKNVKNAC